MYAKGVQFSPLKLEIYSVDKESQWQGQTLNIREDIRKDEYSRY